MFDPKQEVPDLEFCKQLKEAGYPQGDGGWYWVVYVDEEDRGFWVRLTFFRETPPPTFVAYYYKAPTVRELGEWLPYQVTCFKDFKKGFLCEFEDNGVAQSFWEDTEANARAKMLIWLAKKKLITSFKEDKNA